MKTRVIDLLNKIANGEEVPKKIKITILDDRITKKYSFCYDEDNQEYRDDELFPLGARLILERVLNEKVEIIEEDKEIEEIRDERNLYDCTIWESEYQASTDLEKKIIDNIGYLIEKQKELIKAVNELKKGK